MTSLKSAVPPCAQMGKMAAHLKERKRVSLSLSRKRKEDKKDEVALKMEMDKLKEPCTSKKIKHDVDNNPVAPTPITLTTKEEEKDVTLPPKDCSIATRLEDITSSPEIEGQFQEKGRDEMLITVNNIMSVNSLSDKLSTCRSMTVGSAINGSVQHSTTIALSSTYSAVNVATSPQIKTLLHSSSHKSLKRKHELHDTSQRSLDCFFSPVKRLSPSTDIQCSSVSGMSLSCSTHIKPVNLVEPVSKTSTTDSKPRYSRSGECIPRPLLKTSLSWPISSSQQGSSRQKPQREYTCPSYKWIPETKITVDAFSYGTIPNCEAYFLSHFHSDHYMGLTKHFNHNIYCSKATANLVCQQLKVQSDLVHALPIDESCTIATGVEVILLDANHCPGSVMFLFKLSCGKTILHIGDFRADKSMQYNRYLQNCHINSLFLDTTYCSSRYDFPSQDSVIEFVVDVALKRLVKQPDTLIVCGTYTIGKEKIFLALAETLDCKVYVTKEKYRVLNCLESDKIASRVLCQHPVTASIHVVPINKMNVEELTSYLSQFNTYYSTLLAFKPTGWTYSNKVTTLSSIRPLIRGPVTIYGVPYSEHSSFSELKDFVQYIKPDKIISTVGGVKVRRDAETQCYQWLQEGLSRTSPVKDGPVQTTLHDHFMKK